MELFQIVAIVLSLALSVVAAVLVTQAVRSILAVVRLGQPDGSRTANPVGRTVTMVKETFLHTRMLQWTVVGIMHWFVYFAFIVLGAAVFTAYFQLFDPEFQLPIVGHFFLYEWLGEILGVLGTVGIVYLAIYRQKHHPRREGRDSRFYRSTMWQAYFVEVMALLEGSAILFIRGAEYNLGKIVHATGPDADHYTRFHFPVSSFFGDVLFPSGAGSRESLETTIIAIGMIKIVLAMIWLIVIARNLTMGVAWHRFTAWFNIWFKREPSGRTALGAVKPLTSGGKAITLDDIDDLDEDSKLGVGAIEDFSWKNILDFTTCTECGRCQSQCPAWNTEKPLNPKLMITALRDAAYAKAPYLQASSDEERAALLEGNDTLTREVERPLIGDTGDDWFYMPENGSAVIDPDALWSCTNCGACVQQCPVDIEHVDHIVDMRRYAILVESNFPAQLNGLFKGLENKGNPWNMSSTARLDWTKGLDFEVKVVGAGADEGGIESLDEVDWLFWVGCAGAYEDRAKKTTRAVAELLDMAGVSFGVLGNGETCTGDPARRAGNEFVFQGLAQQNVETFQEYKVKKVVSTCAHCFNTLKNEYKEFGIELEVVHHTQLLNRLVREGRLTPVKDGEGAHKRSITYHDPCFIGRHNGVYTPPRELLEILPGAEFVEMERNSEKSFCCGAGGARMWMEENIGERINVNRTVEAVGTGADQIAVGCPFCRVMLSDGLTAQQAKGEAREEVEVLDVAQMLLASVKGEVATKLKPGAGAAVETTPAPAAKAAPATEPTAKESASEGAPDRDEAIEAEPAAGDDTQSADTVTDTADAGPLAKASGGSSLFDEPEAQEPAETADAAKPVAAEAKAAQPEKAGGSLFDVTSDQEDAAPAAKSDAKAEPEVEPDDKVKAAAPAAEKAPAATEGDLGSSGSLFDLGGDETPAEPEAKAEPEATAEPAAAAPAAEKVTSAPEGDLGSSGSLFDLGGDEAPAPTAAEPKPEPEPAAQTETKTEAETAAATEPTDTAEVAKPTAAEPEPTARATVSPSRRSMFDIAAPAPVVAAAATTEATQEPQAEVDSEVEAAAEPEAKATPEPATTPEAEPEVRPTPAATAAPVATPASEIPDGGSLFDIQAPEPVAAPAATAPPTPEPEAPAAPEPEADAKAETTAAPEAEPEPEATPEAGETPAAEDTPEAEPDLTPGQAVSAAATAAAMEAPTQEPDPATEPDPEAATEAVVEQTEEPTTEPETEEQETEEPAGEAEPEEKVTSTSSGASHTPKTDVAIDEAGSLFDL